MRNIVEKCMGCLKIKDETCTIYAEPSVRHSACECPAKITKVLTKEAKKIGASRKVDYPMGKESGKINHFWRSVSKRKRSTHRPKDYSSKR